MSQTISVVSDVPKPSTSSLIPKRPINKLERLDHDYASTLFESDQTIKYQQKYQNLVDDEDHEYPFHGSLHLNPIGVNHEPVRMFMRTGNDFGNPAKLKNPDAPKPKSLNNYEAYQTQEQRMRTQGLFMNDK